MIPTFSSTGWTSEKRFQPPFLTRIRLWIDQWTTLPSGAGALYKAFKSATREGRLIIKPDATIYEISHELQHALHHVKVGDAFFPSSGKLNLAQKEYAVYQRLRSSPEWSQFTAAQQDDAWKQVINLDGSPFPDGSVGPQAPPPGLE